MSKWALGRLVGIFVIHFKFVRINLATMRTPQLHELVDNLSLTYHLENSALGILLWNSNLKLIYCSAKARQIFAWHPVEEGWQEQLTTDDLLHPDDAAEVRAIIEEVATGRVSHNYSLNKNITAKGEVIYCQWYNSALKNEAGGIKNLLSLVQDVTPQMQVDLSLRAHQRQLSLVFNSAIDPMWLITIEGKGQYRFQTINAAFTKVTGWTPEQVAGQPIEAILPPSSHELVRQRYGEAIETGNIIDYVEKAAHLSGTKYGEIRVIPIRDEGGPVSRLLGIANDITDKVMLKESLDAERESRLRQITTAVIRGQELERAKISRELHDNVNQVLTTVKLLTELCLDGKATPEQVLPRCSALLNDSIRDIRTLSKQLSPPTLGNMNFRETLTELVTSIAQASETNIQLHLGLEGCEELDGELHLTIYRIMQEQLTNIMKHAAATAVTVHLENEGATLALRIEDNGVGFLPGKKTLGIGLTNMSSRAETIGGRLHLTSAPGKGTRLVVQFPITMMDNRCLPAEKIEGPAF